MVSRATIINNSDNLSEVDTTEVVFPSTEFAVKVDGELLQPEITTKVEIENDGEMSTSQDQCGHTSRTRTGNNGWVVTVNGLVTDNDLRDGNLSLQTLRDVVATMSEAKIRSDIVSGTYEVSNVVITQPNDLVSIETDSTHGEESAYEFHVQFGESESV